MDPNPNAMPGYVIPTGSMYGIYANIWGILMVNVTIYGIHGSYGIYNWHFSALTGMHRDTCPFSSTQLFFFPMIFMGVHIC